MSTTRLQTRLPTRREILAAGLTACTLVALPAAFTSNTLVAALRRLLAPGAQAAAADIAAARAVLFGASDKAFRLATASDKQIIEHIRTNIAADYSEGRIVNVGGWQLAATECDVLGLLRQLRPG
ncbi:MAG: hypothetical protein ABI885_02265 [Gammaproteobacteria bacterium]